MVRLVLIDRAVESRRKEHTIPSVQIMGYTAHLILEDGFGHEFEVRDGLMMARPSGTAYPDVTVNVARVTDAVEQWQRREEGARPVL